jgi:hypothetical protein
MYKELLCIKFLYSETVRLAENLTKLRQLFESVKDTTSSLLTILDMVCNTETPPNFGYVM